jgi:hypothetical protein
MDEPTDLFPASPDGDETPKATGQITPNPPPDEILEIAKQYTGAPGISTLAAPQPNEKALAMARKLRGA